MRFDFDAHYARIKHFDSRQQGSELEGWVAGMISEIGEVAGLIEKKGRKVQKYTEEEHREEMILELGDVLYYLTFIANHHCVHETSLYRSMMTTEAAFYQNLLFLSRHPALFILESDHENRCRSAFELLYKLCLYYNVSIKEIAERNVQKLTARHEVKG